MKMKALGLLVSVAGILSLSSVAHANTVTWAVDLNDVSMNVQIGNTTFNNIALDWVQSVDDVTKQTVYTLANGPINLSAADGSTFTIGNASFDPDPVLFFSASATNNGNTPLTYSFSFNTPLNPTLSGSINSHAELGLTLTDGLNDGATVQPLAGQLMLKSYDLYLNGTSISKNVDIGGLFTIPSGTAGTSYSADGSLLCTQACVTMSSVLSFTLTGRDSVGFSGKVVQTAPVPVPAAALLFCSGLFGFLGFRRKQINA
jgi:hypothetical protein